MSLARLLGSGSCSFSGDQLIKISHQIIGSEVFFFFEKNRWRRKAQCSYGGKCFFFVISKALITSTIEEEKEPTAQRGARSSTHRSDQPGPCRGVEEDWTDPDHIQSSVDTLMWILKAKSIYEWNPAVLDTPTTPVRGASRDVGSEVKSWGVSQKPAAAQSSLTVNEWMHTKSSSPLHPPLFFHISAVPLLFACSVYFTMFHTYKRRSHLFAH